MPVIFLAFDSCFGGRPAGFFADFDTRFANPFFVFAMPVIIAATEELSSIYFPESFARAN